MRLAATEYQGFADVLRDMSDVDWKQPSDCPAWDVRELAAHNLGMAELAASVFEQRRQTKAAGAAGGLFTTTASWSPLSWTNGPAGMASRSPCTSTGLPAAAGLGGRPLPS
jgi:hypothetical protein